VWYYCLLQTIATDDAIVCPARDVAGQLPAGSAYQYSFAYPNSNDAVGEPNSLTTNFVGHCSQNPYDFGNTVRAGLVGGGAPGIAALMSAAWASLAQGGTPGSAWAAYDNATDAAFTFGETAAASGMRANKGPQCDFLRWCRGGGVGHAAISGEPRLCKPLTPTPP